MIFDTIKRMIGAEKPTTTRAQVLTAYPIRNSAVEWQRGEGKNEGLVLLKIPRRPGRFANLTAKMLRMPDSRGLELDEIGTDVWELCDGQHTIEQVTVAIVTKYKLNRRQAEASVTVYLKRLAERRLVALRTGDGAPTKKKIQTGKRKRT